MDKIYLNIFTYEAMEAVNEAMLNAKCDFSSKNIEVLMMSTTMFKNSNLFYDGYVSADSSGEGYVAIDSFTYTTNFVKLFKKIFKREFKIDEYCNMFNKDFIRRVVQNSIDKFNVKHFVFNEDLTRINEMKKKVVKAWENGISIGNPLNPFLSAKLQLMLDEWERKRNELKYAKTPAEVEERIKVNFDQREFLKKFIKENQSRIGEYA